MSDDPDRWRLGHRPALDGLRGIAILLVLGAHFDSGQLESGGVAGVKVFFTLSGFLITTLLLEEWSDYGHVRLRRFYARRALRLGPALLVVLTAVPLLDLAGFPVNTTPGMVAASLFYVSNWYLLFTAEDGGYFWGALGHTWSLSIEEQFYIVWPLLLIAAARWRGPRGVLVTASSGALLSVATWVATGRHLLATDTSAWCLLVGCALAAWMHGRREAAPSWALTLPVVALVPLAAIPAFGPGAGHIVIPLVTAVALWVAGQRPVAWLEVRWLRWFGRRSYGLYLWHWPVAYAFEGLTAPRPVAVLLGLVLSIVLTEISWRVVEQPGLRVKKRFAATPPSGRPHVSSAGTTAPAPRRAARGTARRR